MSLIRKAKVQERASLVCRRSRTDPVAPERDRSPDRSSPDDGRMCQSLEALRDGRSRCAPGRRALRYDYDSAALRASRGRSPARGDPARSTSVSQRPTGFIGTGSSCGPAAAWKAAVRWIAAPIFLLVASIFGPLSAAEKAFTLSGVNLTLEDVSSEVEVRYRSMRLNRAQNVWNVEALLTNKSSRVIQGPFVLFVESFTGTTGPQQADGLDDSTPAKAFYDFSASVEDGALSPGEVTPERTLSLGVGTGAPSLVTKIFAAPDRGGVALGLVRSLNEVGQPLTGVQVEETGPVGPTNFNTDSVFGVATVGQGNGAHLWKFSAPGYLPVWRQQNLSTGGVAIVASPRLTRRGTNPATITLLDGGQVRDADGAIQINFPAGAVTQNTTATLTPLTGQTLPALLPFGWSPLRAFWLELSGPISTPVTTSLRPAGPISSGETAALVRLNENTLRWDVVQLLPGNGTNALAATLNGGGAYALVVGDLAPIAPPAAQVGQTLPASSANVPDVALLTATGRVNPSSSPASRAPELVTATAEVIISHPSNALPSGLVLRGEVIESYRLSDGTTRHPPQYENFVVGYQRPGDASVTTLQAEFPMRPIFLFGSEELEEATVKVDVLTPTPFVGSVVDSRGGQVNAEGLRVLAGSGDVFGNQAVQLRRLNPTNFLDLVPTNVTIAAAFELTVSGVALDRRLVAQMTGAPTNSLFVLARVLYDQGQYGLQPLERVTTDALGRLATSEPLIGDRLDGIIGAGQYLLLRVNNRQALVTGLARNSAGQPTGGMPVRITGQPWLAFSKSDGSFKLLAPTGNVDVAVTDPATGDTGQTTFVVTDPNATANASLASAAAGPRVVSIDPTNNAVNVSRVTPIEIAFSEPVNPATLVGNAIQVLGTNGQPVAASLTLNLRNTIATLLPTEQLAPSALHTVRLSTNIADATGLKLEGPNTFTFTTESDRLNRGRAELVIFEPGATNIPPEVLANIPAFTPGEEKDAVVVEGKPGSAEPERPVILINESTGETSTVLSKPDGSFYGLIRGGKEDFVSASIQNANGTATYLPVSRQKFDNGFVGLYQQGGILEAESDGGPVQVLVEPGAVKTKTTFRITPLTLQQLQVLLTDPPENAAVLGGFKFGMGGDKFQGGSDISFPVNPASIPLLDGAPPEEGAYALAIVRHLEGGGVAYQVVDKLRYDDGKLISNTTPFQGIGDAFTDAIANNPLGVLGLVLNPTEAIIEAAVTVLVLGNRPVAVTGRVGLCPAFASGGCIDAALDPFLQGLEQFTPTVLQGVAGELIQTTRRPLAGAFVTLSKPNQPTAQRGRLQPGLAYCTSGQNGGYALVMPHANSGYIMRVTHPRFTERLSEPLRPNVDYQLGQGAVQKHFTFEVPVPADSNPRVDVSHAPLFPATNQEAVVTIDAIFPSTPNILVSIDSVEGGTASDVTFVQEAPTSPAPNQTRKLVRVSSAKVVTPKLRISVVTTNDTGGTAQIFHNVQIGRVPAAVTNAAIQVDSEDKTSPQLERSEPLPKGLLQFGAPIVLFFNEPIKADILNQAVQFNLNNANVPAPNLKLSADQTRLEVQFGALQPDTEYELNVAALIEDLAGNDFVPPPSAPGGNTLKLKFRTLPVANGNLFGMTSGGGVAVHNNIAYALERTGDGGSLRIYDISKPQSPQLLSSSIQFSARPHDLAFIPSWAHVRKAQGPVKTNNLLAVMLGNFGSSSISDDSNVFLQPQLLRVIDVSDPSSPSVILGAQLSLRPTGITKVRWDPPLLSFLEIGSDLQQVGLIDLQEMLIGFNATLAEQNAYPLFGIKGIDANGDGDYVDTGDRLPTPVKDPPEFYGRGRSFVPDLSNGKRLWTDYDFKRNGTIAAVVFRQGAQLDQLGNPTGTILKPGYRTLSFGTDIDAPTATVEFELGANPKRVFTLLSLDIGTPDAPDKRHVALVSLAPDSDGVAKLAVIDITQPNAPVLTNRIEFPASMGLGLPQSVTRRENHLLALAMTTDLVLLDERRMFLSTSNNALHPAIVQIVPGAGSGNITLGGNNAGVNVIALGSRNEVIQTTPELVFVRIPRGAMTDPSALAGNATLRQQVLDAVAGTTVVGPARFRAIGGAVSTLDPANPTNHYHVLMRAPGGAGSSVKLGLQALNRSGYPLRNKGRGFAAVRAASPTAQSQLGQEPRQGCDALSDALTAYQLSTDPKDPLFNLYLSKPFALVYEKISIDEVNTLRGDLDRELIWSDFYIEAFIDPEMQNNPVLGPFAARVTGAAEGLDRILLPRASAVAETFPGTYIMGPNPPPVTSAMKIPGTFGTINANNGEFRHDTADLALPGRRMPIVFERTIGGQDLYEGPFGRGWDFAYGQRLTPLRPDIISRDHLMPQLMRALSSKSVIAKPGDLLWLNGSGRIILFTNAGPTTPSAVANDPLFIQLGWTSKVRTYYLPAAQDSGVLDPVFEFQDGQFARLTPDGRQFWYDRRGTLTRIYHRYTQNFHKLIYNQRGELVKIIDGAIENDKRFVEIGYYRLQGDAELRQGLDEPTPEPFVAGKIARLKDYTGRIVDYKYNADGLLEQRIGFPVSTANQGEGGRVETTYLHTDDCSGILQGIIAGTGSGTSQMPLFAAPVDAMSGAINGSGNGAGGSVSISLPANNNAASIGGASTSAQTPEQAVTKITFDESARPAKIELTGPLAGAANQEIAYNSVGLIEKITFPMGNSVTYTYDTNNATLRARRNLISEKRDPGARPGDVLTRSFTGYDLRYNLPASSSTEFNTKTTAYTLTGDGKDIQSIAYENAGALTFDYNQFGQIEKKTTPDGIVLDPDYDQITGFRTSEKRGPVNYTFGYSGRAGDLGSPTSITMPEGAPVQLTYDDRLFVLTATRGDYKERRGYDKNGNPKHIEIELGGGRTRIEDRKFNQVGFLEEITVQSVETGNGTEPLTTRFTSSANDAWRVRKVTYPGGQERSYDYDHLGNVVKMALGTYTEDYIRDLHGNVLEFKQGGILTRKTEYDGHDRARFVKRQNTSGEEITEIQYFGDNTPSLFKITDPTYGDVRETKVTAIDGLGRIKVKTDTGTSVGATRTYTYAAAIGGSVEVQGPVDDTMLTYDSAGRTTGYDDALVDLTFTPDGDGNPTVVTSSEGTMPFVSTFGYDDLGYPNLHSDEVGQVVAFTPLADGVLKEVRDGLNNTNVQSFSVLGEKLTETRANGVVFKTTYDKNRQPAFIGDTTAGHSFTWDPQTFRLGTKNLRSGAPYDFTVPNNLDLPTTVTMPDGMMTLSYDTQGRLTGQVVSYGAGENYQITYTRDALGRIRETTYGVSAADNTAIYTYDKLGPMIGATFEETLGTFVVASSIYADGTRASLTYPNNVQGNSTTEARNAGGRLLSITDSSAELYRVDSYLTATTPGISFLGNIIREERRVDPRRRETARRYTHASTGVLLADVRQTYDLADNRRLRQEVHRHGRADLFAYDSGNRLTRADFGLRPSVANAARQNSAGLLSQSGLAAGLYARTYVYDGGGLDLLLTASTVNPSSGALVLPPLPFAQSQSGHDSMLYPATVDGSARPAPDPLGNAQGARLFVREPGASAPIAVNAQFTFNGLGQLVKIERADGVEIVYGHSPDSRMHYRRLKRGATVESERALVYDRTRLIEEYENRTGSLELVARYYYADDDAPFAADLADAGGNLRRHYFLKDAQRSVIAIANTNGAVIERVTYDTWGQPAIQGRDQSPPQVSAIIATGTNTWLVQFTEPIMPPLANNGPGDQIVSSTLGFNNAFQLSSNGTSITLSGISYAEDALPGSFGSVILLQPQTAVSGVLTLQVAGGAVIDEWGLTNISETITFTNAPAGIVFQGPAFGSSATPQLARSAVGSPMLFHGQYFDYDAGLIYLHARFYDPFTGTFLSQDPLGYEDSVNLYAAFRHNPVSYRDPSGLAAGKGGKPPRRPTGGASGSNGGGPPTRPPHHDPDDTIPDGAPVTDPDATIPDARAARPTDQHVDNVTKPQKDIGGGAEFQKAINDAIADATRPPSEFVHKGMHFTDEAAAEFEINSLMQGRLESPSRFEHKQSDANARKDALAHVQRQIDNQEGMPSEGFTADQLRQMSEPERLAVAHISGNNVGISTSKNPLAPAGAIPTFAIKHREAGEKSYLLVLEVEKGSGVRGLNGLEGNEVTFLFELQFRSAKLYRIHETKDGLRFEHVGTFPGRQP
jgi:RHS repeat-associated protein